MAIIEHLHEDGSQHLLVIASMYASGIMQIIPDAAAPVT
jgi:hypothetical protein